MSQEPELFKATTPDGRTSVEVTLTEALYEGKVTIDKIVTEEFKTESQGKILGWAKKQMTEAMRRNTNGLDSSRP